jgi:hypothetical protein
MAKQTKGRLFVRFVEGLAMWFLDSTLKTSARTLQLQEIIRDVYVRTVCAMGHEIIAQN